MGMINGTRLYSGIIYTGIGTSIGVSTISGIGASNFGGNGNITNISTTSGISASIVASNGISSGIPIISGIGASIVSSVGSSIGTSSSIAYNLEFSSISSIGSSISTAIAAATGSAKKVTTSFKVYRYNTTTLQLYRNIKTTTVISAYSILAAKYNNTKTTSKLYRNSKTTIDID